MPVRFPGVPITAVWVIWVAITGCQLEPTGLAPESPPVVEPITLQWLEPAEGDSVAGWVDLRAEAAGGGGVRRMVFYVDGVPVDSCGSPPWEGTWRSETVAAPRKVTLRADVWDEGGFRFRAPDRSVWQVPDAPPSIHLRGFEDVGAAPRHSLEGIAAYGCDPEDGSLGLDDIEWEVEGTPVLVSARAFDISRITVWPQRIRAWGTDRRGQTGNTPWITGYELTTSDSPARFFQNFAFAFAAADTARLFASLSADFRFFPCSGDAPWSRRDFRSALARWYGAGNRPLHWEWSPRSLDRMSRSSSSGSTRARAPTAPISTGRWYVADHLRVDAARVPGDECAPLPPTVTAVFAANIEVATDAASRLWIRRWVDRAIDDRPASPSLSSLLQTEGPRR